MIDYNALADVYDEHYQSDMCRRENEAIREILNKYDVSKETVLDIGCGTGLALDLVDIPYYQGIDISPLMTIEAEKKHPDSRFINADISKIDVNEIGRHSVALCLFSIPYIGVNAVKKIYDILTENGICICVYYNKPYLNPASVYFEKKEYYITNVLPEVQKVMRAFYERLGWHIENYQLTEDETYTVTVFRKGKQAKWQL